MISYVLPAMIAVAMCASWRAGTLKTSHVFSAQADLGQHTGQLQGCAGAKCIMAMSTLRLASVHGAGIVLAWYPVSSGTPCAFQRIHIIIL